MNKSSRNEQMQSNRNNTSEETETEGTYRFHTHNMQERFCPKYEEYSLH